MSATVPPAQSNFFPLAHSVISINSRSNQTDLLGQYFKTFKLDPICNPFFLLYQIKLIVKEFSGNSDSDPDSTRSRLQNADLHSLDRPPSVGQSNTTINKGVKC